MRRARQRWSCSCGSSTARCWRQLARRAAADPCQGVRPFADPYAALGGDGALKVSTPLPMGLAALAAAQITARDLVLEPSAGTGLLAILAEIAGGSLMLNELADTRADLLRRLFPGRPVTRFDAAQIDDYLDARLRPQRHR